jgi:hypothetical protein
LLRDNVDSHAHFRSEPDAPDPARRQPGGTPAEFNELGEESAIPRKVRTDTIITTASYPSRRPTLSTARQQNAAGLIGRDRAQSYSSKRMGRPPQRGN